MTVLNALIATAMLALFLIFGPIVPVVHAQSFGDCSDPEYRKLFDPRIEHRPFDCVERLRLEVSTEAGPRQMRLLHDRNGGWALSSGALAAFEQGMRSAQEALELIGTFRMDNVTVLLIDGLPPRERHSDDFSHIVALTGASDGECRVGIYLVSAGGAAQYAAYVVAHEIFHCVQKATFSPAQMATAGGDGGDWWIEGSADWFAALALPELGPLPDRIARFDATSADTPLHEMAYEAVVFFLWLNDQRGPSSILPFMHTMADRPGAWAQRRAMQEALGADEWLAFAEAYIGRDIKHPHGTPISISPAEGDTWTWNATRTENLTLEPFVIRRGWVEFECGRWATEVRPGESYGVRADGGAWGDLPGSIDTNDGDASRYRFVGMGARPSDMAVAIAGEIEAGCQPCGGTDVIDTCIVGTWQETGGGPIEWMQQVMQRPTVIEGQRRNVVTTYESDGTFSTATLTAELRETWQAGDGEAHGEGHVTRKSSGRWSAQEGQLNRCIDARRLQGQVTITAPDGNSYDIAVPTPRVSGPRSARYTCSEASMETTVTYPGIPVPMVTRYSRVSEPAE